MKKINQFKLIANKINWMYFAISVIALTGVIMLVISFFVKDAKIQNVFVGLGTGLITSSIVSLFIEIINKRNTKRKTYKYKLILLNPISKITETLYVDTIIRINEFLIDNNQSDNWILNLNNDFDKLKQFITNLKKLDYLSEDEKVRKRLDELLNYPKIYYKELVSLYYDIPFDTLLWEDLISQDEYNTLKTFRIVDVCKEKLAATDKTMIESQKIYLEYIELFASGLLLVKKIIGTFNFIKSKTEYRCEDIVKHLDDKYYWDVYCNSEEYVIQQQEENEAKMEYYSQHPDEIPEYREDTDEEKLYRKINEAIWINDKAKIIALFPQISKDDNDTKSLFTWQLADNLMKDKILRQLYFEKYGIKYKPDKNIWQKSIAKFKKFLRKLK